MIERKMKAAVYHGPRDIRIEEIKRPEPRPGWVLLKVKASGICGSDLHLYKEKTSISISSPLGDGIYVPGHELSGTVAAMGKGVESLKVGERVAVEPLVGCGNCKWCDTGHYNLCNYNLIGFQYLGGFAEYCAVPADKCFVLPEHVSFEEGATLDCIAVAEHAVKRAGICNEDTTVVIGAGAIGLFAVQAAIAAGSSEVYVVGTHGFQLETAKKLGATDVVNAKTENTVERIGDLLSGEGADKIIEAVGGETNVIDEAISMIHARGTIVMTGIFLSPIALNLFNLLTKEVILTSAWGYEYWTHRKEFEVGLDLLAKGKLNARDLITHKFGLDEVNLAYDAAINKAKSESIKVQIVL